MHRLLFVLPLVLAGCGKMPSSLVPLESDAELALEFPIDGEWDLMSARRKSDRRQIISFGPPDGIVVTVSRQSPTRYSLSLRHEDKEIPFECALCRIDDDVYMDLRRPPIEDSAIAVATLRPHFFAKCSFAADSIRLTGCDAWRFKAILEEMDLPFVVMDSSVVFTGSNAQLHDLIRDHSDELFPLRGGDVILRRADDAVPCLER